MVMEQIDVGQVKVAVTFTYMPITLALPKAILQRAKLLRNAGGQLLQQTPVIRSQMVRRDVAEVVGDHFPQGVGFAPGAVLGHNRNFLMELGDLLGQQVYPVAFEQVTLQQSVKAQFRIKLIHSHGILYDAVAGTQNGLGAGAANRHYIDIDVRRQTLVKAQLLFAAVASLLKRCKVEKAEVDRLLDLVGKFAREQQPGDVCLNHLYRAGRMRIESGLAQ